MTGSLPWSGAARISPPPWTNLFGSLPPSDRGEPCKRIVQAAFDEVGETIAFLEDMSLRRAVTRLELVQDDLERIGSSLNRWTRSEPARRCRDRRPTSTAKARLTAEGGPLRTARADETESQATRCKGSELSIIQAAHPAAAHDRNDARAVRREARRLDKLLGQVRGEWQEKLLARRMESLFGQRFVAILENTVLILILALFAMIAAEAVVRGLSPRGLSAGEHLFFAWADLAICSVFLFEFVLKLSLAPNRFSYFRAPSA